MSILPPGLIAFLLALFMTGAPPRVSAAIQGKTSVTVELVSAGFDHKIVLGKWTPMAIGLGAESGEPLAVSIRVLDGDAVPVRYKWPLQTPEPTADGTARLGGLVRFGRVSGIEIEISNANGEVVARKSLSPQQVQEEHEFLSATARLNLIVGLDQPDRYRGQWPTEPGTESVYVHAKPDSFFSDKWIGYESLNRIIFVPQADSVLPFNKSVLAAVSEWLNMGGTASVFCGPAAKNWFGDRETGLLALGLPDMTGTVTTRRTGSLERFINATQTLVNENKPDLVVSLFASEPAGIELQIDNHAGLFRISTGFGQISVLAMDITSEPLASWSGLDGLVARTIGVDTSLESTAATNRGGRVTHLGYSDLSGQLRAAMDRFDGVSFFNFTTVALLVALFIILIGPCDYFFLRRVVGRMEWTWVTFPLITALFCGLAWFIATRFKSNVPEVNQLEIVDIDAESGLCRGTLWSHLYRPSTSTTSIALGEENSFTGRMNHRWLAWQGLPGSGLGGMQNRSDLGLYRRDDYSCELHSEASIIDSMPVQSASTRTLVARWNSDLMQKPESRLRQSNSTDQLIGSFTNPLDTEVENCVLFYGDWAYLLDRPLAAGETIVIETDMREKTLRGYFTRQAEEGGDEVNLPWNPSETRLERIAGMMMFYKLIGGYAYAGLTNDYQRFLDGSHLLQSGKAVMMGTIPRATTPLIFDGETASRHDREMTVLRVVFPVTRRDAGTSANNR
jgi:hypothetical protein